MDVEVARVGQRWFLVFLLALLSACRGKQNPAPAAVSAQEPAPTGSRSASPRQARPSPFAIKLVPADISATPIGTGPAVQRPLRDAWTLFDGDAAQIFQTEGQPARVRVKLVDRGKLESIAIYGQADGRLSVFTGADEQVTPIVGLTAVDLGGGSAERWNRFVAKSPVDVEAVTLEWRPSRPGAAIAELELWGTGASSAGRPDAHRADQLLTGVPGGAVEESGRPMEVSISRPEAAADPRSGTVRVEMNTDPHVFTRAFLVYELSGLPHWSAAARAINGQPARGGIHVGTAPEKNTSCPDGARKGGAAPSGCGGIQVEEIAPTWLRLGTNEIRFLPVDDDDPIGYRVKNLRVVGLGDTGEPIVERYKGSTGSQADLGRLFDGKLETGLGMGLQRMRPFDVGFGRPSQMRELAMYVSEPANGTLVLTTAGAQSTRAKVSVDLHGLEVGWHRFPFDDGLPATDGVRLSFGGAKEGMGRIGELHISASPIPRKDEPRIVVAYPLHGECVDQRAVLAGFVASTTGAGSVQLTAGDGAPKGLGGDGAFGVVVPESAVRHRHGQPWTIPLRAALGDGRIATTSVTVGPCTQTKVAKADKGNKLVEDVGAPFGEWVRAGQAKKIALGDATLEIPAGAVERDVRITVRPLAETEVAPMDYAMTNVTPRRGAYRLGPHHLTFKKPIRITVPYQASLLPEGAAQQEVHTYYFDEAAGRWQRVALVDKPSGGALISESRHFTDFVNATIAIPDHPQAASFNPTSIKDMKLADAAAGVELIAPPAVSENGGANVSFPIEVPPGRNDLEPRLDIAYSSERQNGWLGVGWDLELPSVQIDTRMGVPRYGSETEFYALNGAMLTPTGPAVNGVRTFRHRVEGSFERIERRGTTPTGYHWEVTDKSGTKYVYGESAEARLASYATGDVFRWQLEKMVDAFGNQMTFVYQTDSGVSPGPGGGEPWRQIYPLRIDYTSHVPSGLPAHYHVDFALEDGRPDVLSNARSGFDVRTRKRLKQIDVRLDAEIIRSYRLAYITGDFQKSLLESIAVFGRGGATEFYRHSFDYFQAPKDANGLPQIFAEPVATWGLSHRTGDGVSRTEDSLGGASGSVGIGFGPVSLTVGGGGFGGSEFARLVMFDVNGDGLPEPVDDGGTASLNLLRLPAQQHLVPKSIAGLFEDALGDTDRLGWSVDAGLSVGGVANVAASYSKTDTDDERIVADANGDGFPDLVHIDDGSLSVRLNDGRFHFGAEVPWGALSLSDVVSSHPDRDAAAFFRVDPLVRWTAPYAGTVLIDGAIAKVAAGGDGVTAELFKNGASIWKRGFGPSELTPCVPSGADGCSPSGITLSVLAGDRIYTKLDAAGPATAGSVDLNFDTVAYSPTITYQVGSSLQSLREPYGPFIYKFSQADDHRLAGQPRLPWVAPASGIVSIGGNVATLETGDEVTVRIVKTSGANPPVELLSQNLGAGGATLPVAIEESVTKNDTLSFEILSDTPIDPGRIQWAPVVTYTTFCRIDPNTATDVCGLVTCTTSPAGNTTCHIQNDPVPDISIPFNIIQQEVQVFSPLFQWLPAAPTQTHVVGSSTVSITGTVFKAPTISPVIVLVQGVNRLLRKQVLAAGQAGAFPINFSGNLASDGQVFFTLYSANDPSAAVFWNAAADGTPVPVNIRFRDTSFEQTNFLTGAPLDPMSGGFHRWFVGDWDGELTFSEAGIVFPDPQTAPNPFSFALPRRQGFPKIPAPLWVGRGADSFVAAGLWKPSRSGLPSGGRAQPGGNASLESLRNGSTWNFEFSAGVAAGEFGISAAVNTGDTTSDIDFFDVNGDRFPDSVYGDGVRFSDGHGSFLPKQSMAMGFDAMRRVENRTIRGTASGKDIKLINEAGSDGSTERFVTTGFNVGLDFGMSATHVDFRDINGDGLPDHVQKEPSGALLVRLNLGYGFGNPIEWSAPDWQVQDLGFQHDILKFFSDAVDTDTLRLQDTAGNSIGAGLSGGGSSFGISAGGGVTFSIARVFVDLADVNGDGLPDQVMKLPDEHETLRVKLNLGDHFADEQLWPIPGWPAAVQQGLELKPSEFGNFATSGSADTLGFRRSKSYSGNVGGQVCYGICLGASGFYSQGTGWSYLEFDDIDGDGRLDQVLKLADQPQVYAKLNQVGRSNLLKAVHRPLGGSFDVAYGREGNRVELDASACTPRLDGTNECGTVDMPQNQWVLTQVVTHDGMGNDYASGFDYGVDDANYIAQFGGSGSGFYDRLERESYGYAHVRSTMEDASTVDEYAHNQDFYRRGVNYRTVTKDGAGNVFTVLEKTVAVPPSSIEPLTGTFFAAPFAEAQAFSEGTTSDPNAPVKLTRKFRTYDALGNLTSVFDAGDEGTNDDVTYTIGYQQDPVAYIFKPASIVATNAGNTVLRERTAHYRADGAVDLLSNTLVGGINPATGTPYTGDPATNPTWHFDYDAFGNLKQVIDPKGFELDYSYDPTVRTHRTGVTDSFGYASSSEPNLLFGTVAQTTDVNGNRQVFEHDAFGRVIRIFGPYDIGQSEPTIALEYGLDAGTQGSSPTWARTRHKDPQHPGDSIDTVNFVDGLVRIIQTKKDLERDAGPSTVVGMTVSGAVAFDTRGRVASIGQPTFDTGPATAFVVAPAMFPTTYQYDVLARQTRATTPDGSSTNFEYGFDVLDGVTRFQHKSTDPQGKVRRVLSTVRDETVATIERNTIGSTLKTLVTRYDYDQLGDLLAVTDAKENVTSSEYDTLGQRVALTSPDAGKTEYRYDLSGNLAAKQTARLRAASQITNYEYNFNRLEHINYPSKGDVTYAYGPPGAGDNRAGRIARVVDESGSQDRFYGKLGEAVRTVSTFVGRTPGQQPVNATTTYQFDSFGRMLSMVYPDGEALSYSYDHGGLLASITGIKAGRNYTYVDRLTYNEFEQRARIRYGNGVETQYAYEPTLRRLSTLDTTSPTAGQVQRLRYQYDLVGNILNLKNQVPIPPANSFGGPTDQTYQYDKLYQIVGATGTYKFAPNKQRNYTMSVAYDEIGNLTQKHQNDAIIQPSGTGIVQKPTTYEFAYAYGSSRPHAATHVGDRTYHFDASGNQTGWDDDQSGQRRTISWDDNDQPASIADNGQTTTFLYNAAGERTHKIGQEGEAVYVNQFFTVKSNQIETKHVFAGDSRVATKIARSTGNGTPKENFFWFYHPDHIGSTSYVTDEKGGLFQHEEYFPFGESWVSEHSNIERTPYLFSSKELDEELGLYYYGARYFDPRLSQWSSPDPILNRYMAGAPGGGVFQPINLSLYAYSHNNPITQVDSDGKIIPLVVGAIILGSLITAQFANAPESPEAPTFHKSAGQLALDTAHNSALIYGAASFGAASATTIAEDGLMSGGAKVLSSAGQGYVVGTVVHETADTIDPSGTLGKVCDIALVVQAQVPAGEGLQSRLGPSNPRPSKVGSLPKPQAGKGSVPKAARDPQRVFSPKQKVEKLNDQGGTCAGGCGKKLNASEAKGHHVKRHADGGTTTQDNHAVLCEACHAKIHKP